MTIKQFIEKAKRDYMRKPQEWRQKYPHCFGISIHSTRTFVALADEADVAILSKYRWYMKDGYAVTSIAYKRVKMHHLILGTPPEGKEVDHENRDRLDNRRGNLRLVTRQQNAKNRRAGKNCRRKGKHWEAHIQSDGKQIYLGMFPTESEAQKAYADAKVKYHTV